MKKYKLASILASILIATNSPVVLSIEKKSAIGMGFQYGGIFGWQGSLLKERHRGSVGLGLFGASVGYDYELGSKVSAGVSSFIFSAGVGGFSGVGFRLHYYPNGTFQNGWVYGVDVFGIVDSWSLFSEDEDVNSAGGFFSVGYGFK